MSLSLCQSVVCLLILANFAVAVAPSLADPVSSREATPWPRTGGPVSAADESALGLEVRDMLSSTFASYWKAWNGSHDGAVESVLRGHAWMPKYRDPPASLDSESRSLGDGVVQPSARPYPGDCKQVCS